METVSPFQKPVRAALLTSQCLQSPHALLLAASRRPTSSTPLDPAARLLAERKETASNMSAPLAPSPSSVTFPVATVGVAGMTAEKIADYAQLQAGYRAGQLGALELAKLQVYVMTIHREVAVQHRELERELEAAFQAASTALPQQPAASAAAPAPTVSPATSGDATKIFQFPPWERAFAFAASPMRTSDTTISSRRTTAPERSRETTTRHSSSTST